MTSSEKGEQKNSAVFRLIIMEVNVGTSFYFGHYT